MKLSRLMLIVLATLTIAIPLAAAPRCANCNNKEQPNNTPQIMVANFFNILVQGAIAVSSKNDPEKQIQATAQVLNSIANLAQLAMRKVTVIRKNDPDTTAREIYENLMNDQEFLTELEAHRPEMHAALVAALTQQNFDPAAQDAPHTAHEQID